ncbi:hypothetical protein PF005_g25721 [Phytophthora fragariae]|uniref:Uncharacterized protein n=2 Tax=Phytophthora TaxID=4783 RepID=A0A6A3HXN8_9STRA|nr:hypothetical protein PF003_g7814 [Phytophthora fragariae]KAE8977591.1 hypothetical protein PR001_g25087 [Phytophthora rubi]KAE8922845.1 hypothetical protein PF009_g26893 [Phytophthora fragariae]KAE8974491.1 hypothetical protein PF011_g24843 [Phytophthora fragariae]KAE8978207.1 hypothetical protein PR002_g24785 [Phytophthora rubi]
MDGSSKVVEPSDAARSSRVAALTDNDPELFGWSDSEAFEGSGFGFEGGVRALPTETVSDASAHRVYVPMAMFDSFLTAYRSMNDSSDHVYAYETSYMTEPVLARVYRCRSHDDCGHRIKINVV